MGFIIRARTDHAEAARVNLTAATACPIPEGTAAFAAIAQVHATLALAEQQRLANILEVDKCRCRRRSEIGPYTGPSLVFRDLEVKDQDHDYLDPALAEALGIHEGEI